MKIQTDKVLFETTGRELYGFDGVLGLARDGEVTYGYDGHLTEGQIELTSVERRELAHYMIRLWNDWMNRE